MYGEYVYNLAKYLINKYGINQVSTWIWGVFTEYNNEDHFTNPLNKSETPQDYFETHDFTECSLRKAFNSDNFTIGAHSSYGGWDKFLLLQHMNGSDINKCTMKQGSIKMDFISVSYYEHPDQISHPGNVSNFDEIVCSMNDVLYTM